MKQRLISTLLNSVSVSREPNFPVLYSACAVLSEKLIDDPVYLRARHLLTGDLIWVHQSLGQCLSSANNPFSANEIVTCLSRGNFPQAYMAMASWYEAAGFFKIFEYFVGIYVSHYSTLKPSARALFSFALVFPEIEKAEIPAFLDRFTEFVVLHFSGCNQKVNLGAEVELIHMETVLIAALSLGPDARDYLVELFSLLAAEHVIPIAYFRMLIRSLYHKVVERCNNVNFLFTEVSSWNHDTSKNDPTLFESLLRQLVFRSTATTSDFELGAALAHFEDHFPLYKTKYFNILMQAFLDSEDKLHELNHMELV